MIYSYAHASSNGQEFSQQVTQINVAGRAKAYQDKASTASAERPELKRVIGAVDAGPVAVLGSVQVRSRSIDGTRAGRTVTVEAGR